MTMIVVLAVIVAQELHRVALRNVLGILLHEGLDAVPHGRNCLDVLVQA